MAGDPERTSKNELKENGFVAQLFVEEETGELVPNPDLVVTPQEKNYGGLTPRERQELDEDLPYWQK